MGLTRPISIALLAGLVVTAHLALNIQAEKNGSFDVASIFSFSERHLGNTNIPVRIPRTGYPRVDSYFSFMLSFFWAAQDPRNARAHLHANHILGTLGGGFVLMVLEAHRGLSSSTFLVLTYLIEFFGELLGVGLFTPIWCILHLSLTSLPHAKGSAKEALSAPRGHLQALGYALVLGHVVPTALTTLCKPDAEGWQSQQLWTMLRLFHPIFVLTLWNFFKIFQSAGASTHEGENAVEQRLASTRKFYIYSSLYSTVFHVSTLAILLAPFWIPSWLRADVQAALDLKTVLVPVPFWVVQTKLPVRDAVSIFLQWDDICASSSILVWSTTLYIEALRRTDKRHNGVLNTIIQAGSITALGGPVAAGAFLLHERDSIVLATSTHQAKKQ